MTKPSHVSRINQIDAAQLDSEIYKILKIQTQEITKLCPQEKIEWWQPEIDAFLKFVIWYFSLRTGKSTFGQRLLDLNYERLSRKKSLLYLILSVVPNYVEERFADKRKIEKSRNREKLKVFIETVASIFHFLSFFNLLLFLHGGKQPSVVERILGLTSVDSSRQKPRRLGFSYMTRELLWHGLMELFGVGLPMINFQFLKQTILRFWIKKKRSNDDESIRSNPSMDKHTRCSYCGDSPILPRHADCPHIYCYYCIKAHFTATDTFQCLSCGVELHSDNVRVYIPNTRIDIPEMGDENL